jgi:hypothetical protein
MVTLPIYTWGTEDTAAPATVSGAGFLVRKRRYMAYITSCLLVLALA